MAEFETRRVDERTTVSNSDGHPAMTDTNTTIHDAPAAKRGGSMGWLLAIILIVAAVVAAFAFKLINIDQISSGSLPKVEAVGGSLPKFQVDTAKVVAGTKDETVKVPTVRTEDKTIKLPTLHVEKADAAKSDGSN